VSERLDCLIVGGGPGGLIAATYLARFHRRAVLIDADGGRAQWIPISHNIPGFPAGVSGCDYLALLREQATRYGADLRRGRVERLLRDGDIFHASGDGFELSASSVILATGVIDKVPALADLEQAVAQGRIRLCPICDGYEATDKAVGVVGGGSRAVAEGRFLTAFSDRVTLLGEIDAPLAADSIGEAEEAGLTVAPASLVRLQTLPDGIAAILSNGERQRFDTIYAAMGNVPQTTLAKALGADCNESGCIVTDDHQRTNVPGLYAIGDVVDELNQVAVAAGHAAVAATDVHNQLRAVGPFQAAADDPKPTAPAG
jgi:thioredoxin reductase (NADPH)